MNACRLFAGAMLLWLPMHVCGQEKPKTIDKGTIAAWEKHGFVAGCLGDRNGELTFEVDPAKLDGGVLAFRASQSDAIKNAKKLPALLFAFGLDLDFPATDAVMKELTPLTNLTRLVLRGRGALVDGVSDEGLKELVALKRLTHLDLRDNPVTDVGVKELSALTSLAHLSLHGTKVTGAGVKELAALKTLTSSTCLG
jgi:Leucine Rich repeat